MPYSIANLSELCQSYSSRRIKVTNVAAQRPSKPWCNSIKDSLKNATKTKNAVGTTIATKSFIFPPTLSDFLRVRRKSLHMQNEETYCCLVWGWLINGSSRENSRSKTGECSTKRAKNHIAAANALMQTLYQFYPPVPHKRAHQSKMYERSNHATCSEPLNRLRISENLKKDIFYVLQMGVLVKLGHDVFQCRRHIWFAAGREKRDGQTGANNASLFSYNIYASTIRV